VILITKPNFVLGQQATFSHEFEAHNDLRPLQSYRQLACVAKTASTDIRQIPGLLRAIFRPIEARRNEIRVAADCTGGQIVESMASKRWNSSLGLHHGTLLASSPGAFASVGPSHWRGWCPQSGDQKQDVGEYLSRHRNLDHLLL
jgi:hypothetical protein